MEDEPPYRRIANEIRDRIARGDLSPGDRVPSIRSITHTWDVAMATATKVIVELKHEGLVHTRRGAGTVVAGAEPDGPGLIGGEPDVAEAGDGRGGRRPEPNQGVTGRSVGEAGPAERGRRAAAHSPDSDEPTGQRLVDLNRRRVVRAAVTLADAEGLEMVTMRRVAAELGASTMSLYRHVVSKDDLVQMMVDEIFGEESFPESSGGWREQLETASRMMWAIFRRHPWAAEQLSITRPQMLPNLLPYAEWVLSGLRQLDMDVNDTMFAYLAIVGHVRGTAINIQAEIQLQQDTGMTPDEWVENQENPLLLIMNPSRYPNLRWVATQDFDFSLDNLFEYGLQRTLDGIAVRVEEVTRQKQPKTP